MSTTTTRHAYRRTGTRVAEPIIEPSTCTCGQTFPDLGGLLGHDCPDDIRAGMRAARPADIATNPGDSLDVPEWRGGAKGHQAPAAGPSQKQVDYLRSLLTDLDAAIDGHLDIEAMVASADTKAKASKLIDSTRQALAAVRAKAKADAPVAPCRPNRFAGSCRHCGGHVAAEAGLLCRIDGAWAVEHHDGQCSPAEATPAAPQATQAPTPEVPAGHYAIPSTGDNDLAFYRVDHGKGEWAGRVFVKLVVGGHPDRNVPRSHVAGILARIAADPDAGPRYGQTIGRCCRCNRHLTDDESRAAGIGPECAKRGWA